MQVIHVRIHFNAEIGSLIIVLVIIGKHQVIFYIQEKVFVRYKFFENLGDDFILILRLPVPSKGFG